jgi:hypothetical protein
MRQQLSSVLFKQQSLTARLAGSVAAVAAGAVAIGAIAIGALAIGRLVVKRAKFDRMEIGELTIRRIRVIESSGKAPDINRSARTVA